MTVTEQARRQIGADAFEMQPAEIAGRFAWARRSGHPGWLWPDVAPPAWLAALERIEAVAIALLAGRTPPHIDARNSLQERAFTVAIHTSGVGPWLGWQVEQGRLAAEPNVRSMLLEHLAHSRVRSQRLSLALRNVLAVLQPHAERVVVLKGMHTSHTVFAEPALRPMADLDLLPVTGDLTACERALSEAGYRERREARHARPHRSEWTPPGAPTQLRSLTITHQDNPFEIDLHGTLDIDFFGVKTVEFGTPPRAALCDAPQYGAGAAVLSEPQLAAHIAVHASHGLHSLTLIRMIELALTLRQDMRSTDDWKDLADLLRAQRAERFAFPAFSLVDRLDPGLVPESLLRALAASASPRQRRIVNGLQPATAQRLHHLALDERFMWAVTPIEHVRRAFNMLLPTGISGSLRRLVRIYVERVFRIARLRVSLRGNT